MKALKVGLWVLFTSVLLLQGCTGKATRPGGDGAVIEDRDGAASTGGAEAMGTAMGGALTVEALNDPQSPVYQRVFYFDYDSSELNPADQEVIAAHARLISANPSVSVVVEGHTDERGTREYNLALGERRAKTVERLLTLQGVAPNQLQVISFGEERPVALGHDEDSWRLNRRVELLYSGY